VAVDTLDSDAVSGHGTPSQAFPHGPADDLHSVVVRGVFKAGLALHGAPQRTTDRWAAEQIEEAIAILDETIRKVRALVFGSGRDRTDTEDTRRIVEGE